MHKHTDIELLPQVEMIARTVSEKVIMKAFGFIRAVRKADGSLCTQADLDSQKMLTELLPAVAPYPVLGEEMTDDEQKQLWSANSEGLWVVDPIDGTSNFAHGIPLFTLSIALMRKGRPVLSVIFLPALNECYTAVAGYGAWCDGEKLTLTQDDPNLTNSLAIVEALKLSPDIVQRFITEKPFHRFRMMGTSSIDWCWMAAGKFGALIHAPQKLWDYAPGVLIFLEAGGALRGFYENDYWSENHWGRSAIAASGPQMLKAFERWIFRI